MTANSHPRQPPHSSCHLCSPRSLFCSDPFETMAPPPPRFTQVCVRAPDIRAYVCHPPPSASSLSSLVITPSLVHLLALLRVCPCGCACVCARVCGEMHCDAVAGKQVFSTVRSGAVRSGGRAAQPGWGISAKCPPKMIQRSEEP